MNVLLTVQSPGSSPPESSHTELMQLSARAAVIRANADGVAVRFDHPLEF